MPSPGSSEPLGNAVEPLFIASGFVVFLPTVARRRLRQHRFLAIRRSPAAARLLDDPADLAAGDRGRSTSYSALPGLRDLLLNFSALTVPVGLSFLDLGLDSGLDPPLWTLSVRSASTRFCRSSRASSSGSRSPDCWFPGGNRRLDDRLRSRQRGDGPDSPPPTSGELVRLKLSSERQQLPAWACTVRAGHVLGPGSGSGSATGRKGRSWEAPVPGRVPLRPPSSLLVSGLP